MAAMAKATKQRPNDVPESAVWSDSDNEWVCATLDTKGRKQGLVRYFRPDGTLCCETEHVDGTPHGAFTRYHETGEVSRKGTLERGALVGLDTAYPATKGLTTELCFPQRAAKNVHRYEQNWERGVLVRRLFLDKKGRPIYPDGVPYPPRPKGVPEAALPENDTWQVGAVDGKGVKLGTWITFDKAGALLYEDDYEGGSVVRRTRPAKLKDRRVAFERGPWLGGDWSGPVTLLDAKRKVLRTVDPTGADDVKDPKLAAWAKRVRAVDWSKLASAYGPATRVGMHLLTLGCSEASESRAAALDELWNRTCHQGSTYTASVSVIVPLVELCWLRPDAMRQPILALVFAIASLPAPAYDGVQKRAKKQAKSNDGPVELACVKALTLAAKSIVTGFPSLSADEATTAIACLAGCFGDAKVAALLRKLASPKNEKLALRAAAIVALGNLSVAAKELDVPVKAALDDDDVAIRVAAVMGRALGHHRPGKREVEIMLAALGGGEPVRKTFATLPFVEDTLEVELAQLVAIASTASKKARGQAMDALLAALPAHQRFRAVPIVEAGLRLLFDHEDAVERPSPEAKAFVRAVVDKDDLWMNGKEEVRLVDLATVLDDAGLPSDRKALAKWAGKKR